MVALLVSLGAYISVESVSRGIVTLYDLPSPMLVWKLSSRIRKEPVCKEREVVEKVS